MNGDKGKTKNKNKKAEGSFFQLPSFFIVIK